MGVSGAFIACSGSGPESASLWHSAPQAANGATGEDPIANVTQELLAPLSNAPTFSTGVLTITVAPGELGMVSLRAVDSAVIVNGVATMSGGYAIGTSGAPVLTSITVAESGDGGVGSDGGDAASLLTTEFIVDYSNGLFATGGSGGGITLSLAGSEPTVFGVKGTNTGDTITFGATGADINNDGTADIVWSSNGGAGTFIVSMGNGDDTWSAGGGSGTGGRFNNDAPTNPGLGYGPGVVVYGGAGDDTFLEGAAVTPYETIYGGGQALDTVDYGSRTTSVAVALSMPGIPSTISGECVIGGGDAGDAASDAGAGACVSDEFDDIKNDVFVVNGGTSDDFLTASPYAIIAAPAGVDAGADAGVDAGHADAGDAGHSDAGSDAGHADAGDAGHSDAGSDAGHVDAGVDAGPNEGAGASVVFNGGAGNDTLTPYTGPYVMNGGAGNDKFLMGADGSHGAGTISGGAGVDTIDFSNRTTAIRVTMDGTTLSGTVTGLSSNQANVTENMIVGADVENIHGGAGDDTIVGNMLDNVINGGPGADLMTGCSAACILAGNNGSDTADYSDAVGPVWAQIDGIAHSGAGVFSQTLGLSNVAYTGGTCPLTGTGTEHDSIGIDFTNIIGSMGSDCLLGQPVGSPCPGSTCQNNLTGGPGTDMLFGFDGDDILEGSGGVGGDAPGDSNYLDCGNGYANYGHDVGVSGYRTNCQF